MLGSKHSVGTRGGGGLAVGISLGVALGVAMDNIGAGIAIGVAIGVALAAGQRKKKPDGASQNGPREDP